MKILIGTIKEARCQTQALVNNAVSKKDWTIANNLLNIKIDLLYVSMIANGVILDGKA